MKWFRRFRKQPKNARIDQLIESCSQAFWTTNSQGVIFEDSPSWRNFTGQSATDWLANKWGNVVHPEDKQAAMKVWQNAVAKGIRYETKYRLWHRTLGWRWTRARGIPVLDEQGKVESWIGLNDDITDQVLANEALRESELQFKVLANNVPAIIWVADLSANVYFMNRSWYEYTGATENQSFGIKAADFIREDLRAEVLGKWAQSVNDGLDFELELPLRGKDGKYRWFIAKAHPVHDESGGLVKWIGTMHDIHAQKNQVEQLQAQRKAREQYVLNLSHDLKNAIGAGQSSIEILRTEPQIPQRDRLETIIANSFNRTERMLSNLLDANYIEAGKTFQIKSRERFEVTALIEQVCADMTSAGGIVVRKEISTRVDVFWGREEIRRVLENLIDNARKYRSRGDIVVSSTCSADDVVITVLNWGNPISAEHQCTLFQIFQRLPNAFDQKKVGWGVGLSLVKGIVEAHGGHVSVSSSEAAGTAFQVVIPKGLELSMRHSENILGPTFR